MVRHKILQAPFAFYHVTLRGNCRQDIFRSDADRRLFEWLLRDAIGRSNAEVHAYCWMPNHIHLLIRAGEQPVYRCVQHFAARYAVRFNQTHGTTGHLFQGRYWAGLIDTDSYLLATLRYIHLNPVSAGLAATAGEFPWSSHLAYTGERPTPWLTTSHVLSMFDEVAGRARTLLTDFIAHPQTCAHDEFIALLQTAEQRFDVRPRALLNDVRGEQATFARAWLAYYATRLLGMNQLDVAARLGRSPRALSNGIDTWIDRIRATPPEHLLSSESAPGLDTSSGASFQFPLRD